jgi:hypothetical protein
MAPMAMGTVPRTTARASQGITSRRCRLFEPSHWILPWTSKPGLWRRTRDSVLARSMSAPTRKTSFWPRVANARSGLVLATLTLIAGTGALFAPLWLAIGGFALLLFFSLWDQHRLRPRFAAVGALDILDKGAWVSAGHCVLAAAAAYGWGLLVRLVFYG